MDVARMLSSWSLLETVMLLRRLKSSSNLLELQTELPSSAVCHSTRGAVDTTAYPERRPRLLFEQVRRRVQTPQEHSCLIQVYVHMN